MCGWFDAKIRFFSLSEKICLIFEKLAEYLLHGEEKFFCVVLETKISDIFYVDNLLGRWRRRMQRDSATRQYFAFCRLDTREKTRCLAGLFWKGAPSLISFLKGGSPAE